MKILYIDHYAGSPRLGMEYRPFHMAREWVKAGHEVTIVGSSFSHYRANQVQMLGKHKIEEEEGVRFLWLATRPYDGNGIGRIWNIVEFLHALKRIDKFLPGERFDAVIASSTYPYDNYSVARFAKKWNAAHIFEVHDLWPLSPIELGGYKKTHPFILFTQKAEDDAYRKADAVISILPKAESYMVSRGLAAGKFHWVPNGVTPEEIEGGCNALPEAHAEAIRTFRRGRFLIGYAGAHGLANALDSFLKIAPKVPEIGLVLVGNGTEKQRLREKYQDFKNILFLDFIPKSSIPSFLSQMDALYIGLQRQSLFRFGISPNKIMDYMLAGKPIICAIEAGNDIVGESGCGITTSAEDSDAIAAAARQLAKEPPQALRELGIRGRNFVLEQYDTRKLAARMLDVLIETHNFKNPSRRRV
ncbi:MAG: glycosyltransferase family 4 protein [Rectinemataceae bacterium]|nr:glycosyltransferase family 4 protein [Rectinemataceae bacterium]